MRAATTALTPGMSGIPSQAARTALTCASAAASASVPSAVMSRMMPFAFKLAEALMQPAPPAATLRGRSDSDEE
jgi:hypothetical protein